jgi:DNA invertase Pin-like site-specific DNA recombinase
MADRSRQFRRVSTRAQDALKQRADLDAWDESHGYEVGPAYSVDGKSAFHGRQIPALERAVEDMEAGEYEVLVFWAADRMWRGESLAKALAYVERVHTAGGRVEFVKDAHLNVAGDSNMAPWVRNMLFAQAFGVANAESERKRQRTQMDIEHHKATGSVHSRPPWGYKIVGAKDNKSFVPTETGRRWIPVIYDLVINGRSLRYIVEYLTSEAVPTQKGNIWGEGTLAGLIANPAYKGMRRGGGPNLKIEALVSPTTWDEAQLALASRARIGRGTTKQPSKALLRPVCGQCFGIARDGCTDGVSPMYRVIRAYSKRRGPKAQRGPVYRCTGHGPQRTGCDAEIPVEQLDRAVIVMLSVDMRPHVERVFVPGDDRADQISRLHDQAAEAMRQGDYERSIQCMKDAAELEKQPSTRPHWDEVERDITRGEHFASLDDDARREYLKRWRPVARVEDGRVLIDLDAYTDEHGVKIGLRTDGSTKPALTIRSGLAGDVRISVPAGQAS